MTERYSYRGHRRHAQAHFTKRWRGRISPDSMPDYALMMTEVRGALKGTPSAMLKLGFWSYKETHWHATAAGKTITLVFDHYLDRLVTVWERNPLQTPLE